MQIISATLFSAQVQQLQTRGERVLMVTGVQLVMKTLIPSPARIKNLKLILQITKQSILFFYF